MNFRRLNFRLCILNETERRITSSPLEPLANKHTRLFPRITFNVIDNFPPTPASVGTNVSMATTVGKGRVRRQVSRIPNGASYQDTSIGRIWVKKYNIWFVFVCIHLIKACCLPESRWSRQCNYPVTTIHPYRRLFKHHINMQYSFC